MYFESAERGEGAGIDEPSSMLAVISRSGVGGDAKLLEAPFVKSERGERGEEMPVAEIYSPQCSSSSESGAAAQCNSQLSCPSFCTISSCRAMPGLASLDCLRCRLAFVQVGGAVRSVLLGLANVTVYEL